MKKLILRLMLIGFLAVGCVSIKVKHDPNTGITEYSYFRTGDQAFDGFTMSKNADGTFTVSFDKQEGKGGDWAEAFKNLTKSMNDITKRMGGMP